MYAPLQILSAYSLLKNPNTITQIIRTAKDRHYEAIALTDINVMYGAVEFYQKAKDMGIKPLFGVTLQVNGLVNTSTTFPLVLIAENQTGYQNLMWLSSAKMTAQDTTMTFDLLVDHLQGIHVILPHDSELSQLIASEYQEVDNYWHQLSNKIDNQHLYIGIHPQLAPQIRARLAQFSQIHQASLVALDDVDYLNADDAFTTQVLKAIDANVKLDGIKALAQQSGSHVLVDFEQLRQSYQDDEALKLAFKNNEQLVARSHVSLTFKQTTALPPFQLPPETANAAEYLKNLAMTGLNAKMHITSQQHAQYLERLHNELAIINKLGFNDYFLIVWDIVNFAKQNHIQLGAGRGSAAGSLVAFSLGITDIDPVKFGLLFERFLNAERVQMPDIDIDWPDNRREDVLAYLHQKYGQRNFAQIITFGTLAAKQALRDTARVFGVSQTMMSRISNAVPQGKQGRRVTIGEALKDSEALSRVLGDIDNGDLLLKTAQKIEGLPRNYSTHAAGVVLSDSPLVNTLPVQSGSESRLLTQFEKNPVEALGLLKIDILGLSNLTILAQTLYYAKQYLPDRFDIGHVPLDDKATLALYAKGDTNGVFQFESSGIKHVLKQLQPATFEHIVAVNALYRPGPSRNIESFIKRRHGQETVTVLDPSLKTILAPTFGIIVYQEQVMLVAEKYAGFTLGEADVLRSAMSKKKLAQMADMHGKFISGAVSQGHDQSQAEQIFAYIDEFANYGFNRSHAVAYSKLSFQLAYMKVHYPIAFFTALLNANLGSPDKIRLYVTEAKARGIVVKAPNVNQSDRFWTINKDFLQMGLHSIKGVRTDFVAALIDERKNNGPFESIQSLVRRLPEKFRKRDILTQMVYAGALDGFGYNRVELVTALDDLIEAASFGELILSETKIKKMADMTLTEKLVHEKETIGVNLSGHPLDNFASIIKQNDFQQIADVSLAKEPVKMIVMIDSVRQTRTKKGETMAFVTVSDTTGTISLTIFHQLFVKISDMLKTGKMIQITGQSDSYNGKMSVIARQITAPPQIPTTESGTWFLRFDEEHDNEANRHAVIEIFKKHHGDNPIIIHWQKSDQNQQIDAKFWMNSETAIIRELAPLLGYDNIVFRRSR